MSKFNIDALTSCDYCGHATTKKHPAASFGGREYCASCINEMDKGPPLDAWNLEVRNEGEKNALERWKRMKAWAKEAKAE